MRTWTTFHTVIENAEIRLDTLDSDDHLVGWVVRRGCLAFEAYVTPDDRPGVLDLLNDGVSVGIFPEVEMARDAIVTDLALEGPITVVPTDNVVHIPARA